MKYVLIFILVILSFELLGQNLVPNHSFEELSCPEQSPHVYGATSWYNPNQGSPDYYGIENIGGCIVEYNSSYWIQNGEWQEPQHGQRMSALVFYVNNTCIREYIGCKLLEPLEPGVLYSASMYVSLTNLSTACTNCFGFYFSQDSLTFQDICGLNEIPQAEHNLGILISDTLNWVEISTEFFANGGEEYMIIGNIRENSDCVYSTLYNLSDEPQNIKYFIDNLVVEKKNSEPTSVVENVQKELHVFPVPCNFSLQIKGVENGTFYEILDINGKNVSTGILTNGQVETSDLDSGLYLLRLYAKKGDSFYKRFIKE